jgi:hypothetical protein
MIENMVELASRDRSDGLVVANDGGCHLIRLILLGQAAQACHTVSQTNQVRRSLLPQNISAYLRNFGAREKLTMSAFQN